MARVTYVKKAQPRYEQTVVRNEDGTPKRVPVMNKRTKEQKVSKRGPVFLTIKVDDKSRPKPLYRCDACGKDIEIGTPYKHVTPKSGPYGGYKRTRHADCPTWRPSELSSSKMAGIMAAQEAFEESIDSAETFEDIKSLVDDVANAARDVAQEYIESADNMESGFGHETSMSEELRQRADDLESWANDLESALDGEDEEPTVDHMVYTAHSADGTQVIEEEFETEEDAQAALDTYTAENGLEDDAGDFYIEGADADEPNEEETENWLEALRERASDAINEVPV